MKMPSLWPLAAIALGLLVLKGYGCERESQGVLKQQIKARETVIAALAKQQARVDTEYVRGKTVYLPTKARWDSVMADTNVKKTPEILIADSAVKSCSRLVETCERRVAIRDSIMKEKDTLISYIKKRRPSRFGCAAPFVFAIRGFDLGAACGFRF